MDDDLTGWLRDQIGARKAQAGAMAAASGGGGWAIREFGAFDLAVFAGDVPVADVWREDAGEWIAANDPASVIAGCEMQLAILGEHRHVLADRGRPEQGQSAGSARGYRIVSENPAAQEIRNANGMHWDNDCHACRCAWPCRTVRLLGERYGNQDGWRHEWAA